MGDTGSNGDGNDRLGPWARDLNFTELGRRICEGGKACSGEGVGATARRC
jgi:hypothetical protein